MIQKHLLVSDRVHRPPREGFSWVDRRFLREFVPQLTGEAILLYFFLTAVSDKHSLSFYSDNSMAAFTDARTLSMCYLALARGDDGSQQLRQSRGRNYPIHAHHERVGRDNLDRACLNAGRAGKQLHPYDGLPSGTITTLQLALPLIERWGRDAFLGAERLNGLATLAELIKNSLPELGLCRTIGTRHTETRG